MTHSPSRREPFVSFHRQKTPPKTILGGVRVFSAKNAELSAAVFIDEALLLTCVVHSFVPYDIEAYKARDICHAFVKVRSGCPVLLFRREIILLCCRRVGW